MSHASPVETVRNFCAEFGPTYDDAVAACRQFLHPDVNWQSVIFNDHPVDGLDALLDDLRRALETFRASGFRMDVRHIQADGDVVSVRRTDELLDGEGNSLEAHDIVSTVCLEDGKIRCARDRFFDSGRSADAWGD
ncbi:nuclear transport factor 2 family protein [Streptomyces sp. NPDC059718]